MKYLITIFLVSISYLGISQKLSLELPKKPFERLKFTNFEPYWMVDIFDSTLVRLDTFNGYNSQKNIRFTSGKFVSNNKFYRCHSISKYDYLGFRVSCIDISSGKMLWSRIIDTSHFERQILPVYQNFDRDGNLVLIGFRKLGPYKSNERAWGFVEPCKLFRLVLNAHDGSIISYHSPESNENIPFSAFRSNTDIDMFNFTPDGELDFLYRKNNAFPLSNTYVIQGKIDSVGSMIFNDSLEYKPKNNQIFRSRYAQKGDNYFCLERRPQENAVYLIEINKNLQEQNRYKVEYYNIESLIAEIQSYTDEYMIYVQYYIENEKETYRIYKYDYNGNLLNFYDVKNSFLSNYVASVFSYDNKTGKLIIFSSKIDRNFDTKTTKGYLDINLYDGKTYELMKRIEIINENRDFLPYWVHFEDEENIYFDAAVGYVYYKDDGMSFPGFVRAQGDFSMALMHMSRESLGLEPSHTTNLIGHKALMIYPNPTNGIINIFNVNEDASVNIYNLQGQCLEKQQIMDNNIDIRHLSKGMYVLKIETKLHKEFHKVIKID